jgi:nicotinamide-nucleotide amidase
VGALRAEEAGAGRAVIGEARRAAVVAVGDELIRGERADSNSGEIAAALADLGIEVERVLVLGDDAALLERAFVELCGAYRIVVATGGLGPTLDDVTRDAAAAAARVKLVRSPEVLEELSALWRRRGREMPRSNARQAEFPEGAQVMANRCGTAPGFRVWIEGGMLAALPGPPREMRDMLARELVPYLRATCGVSGALATRRFFLLGLSESEFADRAGAWMERAANPLMGVTAHHGVLHVTLRARAESEPGANALVDARAGEFRARFRHEVFSEDEPRPHFAVGRALIERGIGLALAESCTGGLLAARLTEVPGISAVLREAWVTYSNEAKTRSLGVSRELIERHGAVSREVAEAMASGAARAAGARLAVSITGIAGPEGGTPEKPVGTVWIALAFDGRVDAREHRLAPLSRDAVRAQAVHAALDRIRRAVLAARGAD